MTHSALTTLAEQSNFRATGKIEEVERLSREFAAAWPQSVRSIEYGRSAEGRPMRALLVSRTGASSHEQVRARKIPLLMLQGGIHPGESDGKDAGFIAIRELLEDSAAPGVLDKIAILFVPAFNTDGHERTGRWNRPNQRGPEETGWRTTAQNLNLNRDYTKADSPEMQAMLRLIDSWDPLVCADLHVTDGADFEPDISIQVEPINQGDPQLRASGLQLRNQLIAKLAALGSMPLDFYPDLAKTDDPSSGFALTVYSPRFSTGYFAQRNRFTVLVETHSWKEYAVRVRITRNTVVSLAELVAAHGAEWLKLCSQADVTATKLGGAEVTLDYVTRWREPAKAGSATSEREDTADARLIDFRGYAYTRTESAISGGLVTAYDPKTPQIWRVPMRDAVKPLLVVKAPGAGYVVPAAFAAQIAPRLEAHGIAFRRVQQRLTAVAAGTFRARQVQFSVTPFEGRMRAQLTGAWSEQPANIEAGALFVPIAQPLARLISALFEPQAPDSFAAWGFFNACFEQKEQMEPYVAEQIAGSMLAADAGLREEFNARLRSDPAFAGSPSDRLEFFLRRHTSWDERYNLYPVLRVDTPL
ncbi:MAG: M14 family zinc carboxypeptidase [Steroidobacteraceae bacterium]